jgi:chromate reductase, NAD(P)H dehydrogenase (quinone)
MTCVLILVSSVGKNVPLAESIAAEVASQEAQADIVNLVDLDLPLYSTRAEAAGIPDKAGSLAKQMSQARALVFVAPEYNGSVPPVLNNMIAWVSRSGDDWRAAFNGKMAVIATHSGGGGMSVLAAMRAQLSYVGVNVLGRQLHTHFKKTLNPESTTAVIRQLLELSKSTA